MRGAIGAIHTCLKHTGLMLLTGTCLAIALNEDVNIFFLFAFTGGKLQSRTTKN